MEEVINNFIDNHNLRESYDLMPAETKAYLIETAVELSLTGKFDEQILTDLVAFYVKGYKDGVNRVRAEVDQKMKVF